LKKRLFVIVCQERSLGQRCRTVHRTAHFNVEPYLKVSYFFWGCAIRAREDEDWDPSFGGMCWGFGVDALGGLWMLMDSNGDLCCLSDFGLCWQKIFFVLHYICDSVEDNAYPVLEHKKTSRPCFGWSWTSRKAPQASWRSRSCWWSTPSQVRLLLFY